MYLRSALNLALRQAAGRDTSPTAAIIHSQSAKAAQKGGSLIDPQDFDAGKKVTGRKRHILVDTLGLMLGVSILPANIQDRDGARVVAARAPALSLHRKDIRRRGIPGNKGNCR